jgi:pantothenate kinase
MQSSESSRRGNFDTGVQELAQELIREGVTKAANPRFILGIVGIPASGKSSLATQLADCLNRLEGKSVAIVVPKDGFHLANAVLDARGLRAKKGIPETFDAQGFVHLVERLRSHPAETIWCPSFDRQLDASVEGAIEVNSSHRVVIVEGNYLLLNISPWDEVRSKLDQVWYVDIPREVSYKRLMQRHLASGRSEQQVIEKIESTDMPNADLIEKTRERATRIVRLKENSSLHRL